MLRCELLFLGTNFDNLRVLDCVSFLTIEVCAVGHFSKQKHLWKPSSISKSTNRVLSGTSLQGRRKLARSWWVGHISYAVPGPKPFSIQRDYSDNQIWKCFGAWGKKYQNIGAFIVEVKKYKILLWGKRERILKFLWEFPKQKKKSFKFFFLFGGWNSLF